MPLDEVMVPALDRAFLFGDAIYEVMRVYGAKVWRLEDHLQRLQSGLTTLKIANVDLSGVRKRILETLEHSGLRDALIYTQITRGAAARSHAFPKDLVANELIYVEEFTDPYRSYRLLGASAVTHADIRWSCNDIKSTSLIANCMLAQIAVENGCLETILIDAQGFVTEGSHSSIFAVQGGELLMAPASPQVLPGITKKQILELAQHCAIPLRSHRLKKEDLADLDEIFLTATPEEIIPIIEVDKQKVGQGQPGATTRKLQEAFQEKLAQWV